MILQTRALSLAVDRLAARSQRKHDANEVDQRAQAGRVRVRSEVAGTVVAHEPREGETGEGLVRHLEVRIALVISQAHVERRLMALDQVRFEDQRFDFVAHHQRPDVDHALDHLLLEVIQRRTILKVRAHAAAQRDGLPHVEYGVAVTDHHIDAGFVRNLSERSLEPVAYECAALLRRGDHGAFIMTAAAANSIQPQRRGLRREFQARKPPAAATRITPKNTSEKRWITGMTWSR